MTAHALSPSPAVVADLAFHGPTPSSLSPGGTIVVVPTDALPPARKMFGQATVYGVHAERPGQRAYSVSDIDKTGVPVVVIADLSTDKDDMRGVPEALALSGISVRMLDLSEQPETRDLIAKGQPLPAALASLRGRIPPADLLDRATLWGALRAAPIAAPDKTVDQHGAAAGGDGPSSSPLPNAPATKTDQQNHARRWLANGFGGQLLTTQPGSKVTHVSGWQKRRQPDAEIIANVENGHGLGLLMGMGLVAFDVEDTEFAPDIRAHLVAQLGPNAPVRSRPGSESCAFLVRAAADDSRPIPSAKISARTDGRHGVRAVLEVVAINNSEKTPRYLHVEGRRDDAGVVLQWTRQPVAAELPVLSRADVDALLAEIADTIRARSPGVELTTNTGDDAGTSKRDDGPNEWAGRAVLDDMTPLLSALSLIENGAWCDYDEWKRGAFGFAALSGGDDEVLSAFQDWSFPPNGDNGDSAPGIFEKGRSGGLSTPPGPAAGIIAGWLRQYPVAGQEDAARTLADQIVSAVEERTRTSAHEEFHALEDGGGRPSSAVSEASDDSARGSADKKPWALWRAKIAAIRAARHEAGQTQADADGEQGFEVFGPDFEDVTKAPVEVRPDITPAHARGEVSIMAAASGAGKSSLAVLIACAIAWERPDLIGLDSIGWPGDVLIFSNEDRHKAVRRKIKAVAKYHNLEPDEQKHNIVVKRGRVALLQMTRDGFVPGPEFLTVLDWIADHRTRYSIGLVVIDTLASAKAGGDEKSNDDMQLFMNAGADIADAAFCSVEFLHHNRKGDDGSLAAVRGASAIGGAARSNVGLTKASKDDANRYGWSEEEQGAHVWWTGIQANDRAKLGRVLFKFVSIALPAIDPREPDGLHEQVVPILTHVAIPAAVAACTADEAFEKIKAALDQGKEVRRGGSTGPEGADAASAVIGEAFPVERKAANALVTGLIKDGRLIVRTEWRNRKSVDLLVLPGTGDEAGNRTAAEGVQP